MDNPIVVFSKPWKDNLDFVASEFARLGVDGFELPIRPGYAVEPTNAKQRLGGAVETVARHGQRIFSVAADPSEAVIEACGAAGVPMLRYCIPIDMAVGYAASVERFHDMYRRLEPTLIRSGVTLGVQNHCFNFVGSALGLMQAIDGLEHAVAVLDLTHCVIAGEPFAVALDIAGPKLAMVNLKGVIHHNIAPAGARVADYELDWVIGREGILPWGAAVNCLQQVGFVGPIGLSPDYGSTSKGRLMGGPAWPMFADDAAYLRELLGRSN